MLRIRSLFAETKLGILKCLGRRLRRLSEKVVYSVFSMKKERRLTFYFLILRSGSGDPRIGMIGSLESTLDGI